jgi:hypothetical protein
MRHAAGVLRVPYGAIYDAGYFPSYYWSRYMMAHYPPEIRAWIVSKGGLTPDLKILRGEELAPLVPMCSSEGEEAQSEPESLRDASVYGSRAVESRPLPPPDTARREVPPSYGGSQQGNYRDPPAGGGGRAGTRLLYGAPAAVLNAQDATPSASPIPGQGDPRVTGSGSPARTPPAVMAR